MPVLPQLAEIRQHADREEGQDEEDHPEDVGLADGGGAALAMAGRRRAAPAQADRERREEAEDEFREALPDFDGLALSPAVGDVDVIGPDIARG